MNSLPGRLLLIGHPVSHSLSPTFQNAALQHAGRPLTYEAMDIAPAQLARAAARLRETHASGNVTVPHKAAFAALCDRLTPIAERVGAVNTFWVDDGVLVGDNTDVGGFEEAVAQAFGDGREWPRVALLGAGGAAAAVAAAAERWTGSAVALSSRNPARARQLADRFPHVHLASSVDEAVAGASLVVNATPLGLHPGDPLPVPVQALPSKACVFDLVCVRGETAWVRAARAAGHPAADGMGMLIAQGALAFERWFGEVPDREVMWAAVRGLNRHWRTALDGALALAVPRSCVACRASMGPRDAGLACGTCWSRLPLLPSPWCTRCGHPAHASQDQCPVCDLLDPRCTRVRSVCWVPHAHSSPLLAALKYQGWWGIADAMAERMVRTGRDVLAGFDALRLVPVPLAPGRLRERGFNQSTHLARAIARRVGGSVLDDVLVRIRATVSQTQLTPAERRANVQHAFAVSALRSEAIQGFPLVLIDDVFTTGATLNACATALLQSGASDIRYWTFGRARSDADRP